MAEGSGLVTRQVVAKEVLVLACGSMSKAHYIYVYI